MKPIETQYVYKKQLAFTLQQKNAFKTLEDHGVNINQFIRSAISDKITKDWKEIKAKKSKDNCPF